MRTMEKGVSVFCKIFPLFESAYFEMFRYVSGLHVVYEMNGVGGKTGSEAQEQTIDRNLNQLENLEEFAQVGYSWTSGSRKRWFHITISKAIYVCLYYIIWLVNEKYVIKYYRIGSSNVWVGSTNIMITYYEFVFIFVGVPQRIFPMYVLLNMFWGVQQSNKNDILKWGVSNNYMYSKQCVHVRSKPMLLQ